MFESGVRDIHDNRISQPSTSRTGVKKVRMDELILENRFVTVADLLATMRVSMGSVHSIIPVNQEYYQVCARWVPGCLTNEHKSRRYEMGFPHLKRLKELGNEYVESGVTGIERCVCVHHFDP